MSDELSIKMVTIKPENPPNIPYIPYNSNSFMRFKMSDELSIKMVTIKPENPPNIPYNSNSFMRFKIPLIKHLYPELFKIENKQTMRSIEDPWEISQDVK